MTTIIRWNKTHSTWHTDVDKVGRYAVWRMGKRKPYAAYLNGERIMSESVSSNVEVVKRYVETRIEKALDIAHDLSDRARQIEKIVQRDYLDADTDAADLACEELRKDPRQSNETVARIVAQLIEQS